MKITKTIHDKVVEGGKKGDSAIFCAWERLSFGHPAWHLFVLAGSVCHFFSILFYVVPTE